MHGVSLCGNKADRREKGVAPDPFFTKAAIPQRDTPCAAPARDQPNNHTNLKNPPASIISSRCLAGYTRARCISLELPWNSVTNTILLILKRRVPKGALASKYHCRQAIRSEPCSARTGIDRIGMRLNRNGTSHTMRCQ